MNHNIHNVVVVGATKIVCLCCVRMDMDEWLLLHQIPTIPTAFSLSHILETNSKVVKNPYLIGDFVEVS